MLKLNYYSHLLLNSKYKIYINLFIILTLYTVLYENKISYCMMEGNDIPFIAEAKPVIRPRGELSNLGQLVQRNMNAYIGDKALIENQQEEIARLVREIEFRDEAIKALDTDGMLSTLIFEYDDNQEELRRVCEQYNKPMATIHPDFDFFDQQRDIPKEN